MRPIGPSSPMRSDGLAAQALGRRAVGEVGRVALARVQDRPAVARGRARSASATVGTIAVTRRQVVAERLAEAAGLEEIALHVDDDERGARGSKRKAKGLAGDFDHGRVRGNRPGLVLRRREAPEALIRAHREARARRMLQHARPRVRAAASFDRLRTTSERRATINGPPCSGR